MTFTIEEVARLCHEVNRVYCAAIGDSSQTAWESAPQWQRDSQIDGVRFRLTHPFAMPSESHMNWMAVKLAEGWSYGPVKNPELKQHPCMVSFEKLPGEQQAKDFIFASLVESLRATHQIEGVL